MFNAAPVLVNSKIGGDDLLLQNEQRCMDEVDDTNEICIDQLLRCLNLDVICKIVYF